MRSSVSADQFDSWVNIERYVSLSTRQKGGSSQTSTWCENKSVNSSLAENIWHPRGLELQHWLLEMVITDICVPMTYWEIFESDISSEARPHTVSENLSLWLKAFQKIPNFQNSPVYNKLDRGIWAHVLVINWSGNRTLIFYGFISWQQSMTRLQHAGTNEMAVWS